MENLIVPLGYRYVAIAVMIMEINHCVTALRLPSEARVEPNLLRTAYVSPPQLGFGGALETDAFCYIFRRSGRIREISRINRFGDVPLRELQWRQSRMKSLITTNEAYELATNWLAGISVGEDPRFRV